MKCLIARDLVCCDSISYCFAFYRIKSWDLLNNFPLSRKGREEIVRQIKLVEFSSYQNAAKLVFSMESYIANLLYLFIGVEFL